MQTEFLSSSDFRPSSPLVDRKQCGHRARDFEQYITPEYVAEMLVESLGIRPGEAVVDAGCGPGPFLKAIPQHADAVGIEIDRAMADYAVKNSGRPVIVGDFKTVALPFRPTLFVGNPPYEAAEFDPLLRRIYSELRMDEGRAAFILPTYKTQWARPVMEWAQLFSIHKQSLPRDIFPNSKRTFEWVVFTKEKVRRMWGFLFYPEIAEVKDDISPKAKLVLIHGHPGKSAWRAVLDEAIKHWGRPASLSEIYQFVAPRRPYEHNAAWKNQLRKLLYTGPYKQDSNERWDKAA